MGVAKVAAKKRAKTVGKKTSARGTNAEPELDAVMSMLKRRSSKATLGGMARYGIPSDTAIGVTMSGLKAIAKELGGKHHALAAALWGTGVYEARLLASLIDDPAAVTAAQMDAWCRDFDNWGIADTVCFALFDRTPHAWKKVEQWHSRKVEFEKRGAFALLWGLTVHDKAADDAHFVRALEFVEAGATDERHFVKKSVNMALRSIGKRNAALNKASIVVAKRLAASDSAAAAWVGRDALRELTSASVSKRVVAR